MPATWSILYFEKQSLTHCWPTPYPAGVSPHETGKYKPNALHSKAQVHYPGGGGRSNFKKGRQAPPPPSIRAKKKKLGEGPAHVVSRAIKTPSGPETLGPTMRTRRQGFVVGPPVRAPEQEAQASWNRIVFRPLKSCSSRPVCLAK